MTNWHLQISKDVVGYNGLTEVDSTEGCRYTTVIFAAAETAGRGHKVTIDELIDSGTRWFKWLKLHERN